MWQNEFSNIIRDKDGVAYEGPSYYPNFPISGYRLHTIRPEQEYRADKIAKFLYDREELSWVLDVANSFRNGFKEYKRGLVIKYPVREALIEMGIL